MTKEEWNKVESRISSVFSIVKLKIDGYNIALQPVRISALKYCIAVYVNGKIKGEWIAEDCEIRRKFYHCRTKCFMSLKEIDDIIKKLPKKEREKSRKECKEKYTYSYYEPYFYFFKTL